MRDSTAASHTQLNGRTVKESLLSGPNGFLKTISIWEGSKLITVILIGK